MNVPPNSTVTGGNILSMLAAMGPFQKRGEQILEEEGIRDVQAESWYSLPAYARALQKIAEKMGPNTLLQIGKQIPNHISLPPGLDTPEKVMTSFGVAYDMNHRGVPPGTITVEMTSPTTASLTTRTAYPCDFDRGVIQGFFQKLVARRVDMTHGPGCKKQGAESCTHLVSWPSL